MPEIRSLKVVCLSHAGHFDGQKLTRSAQLAQVLPTPEPGQEAKPAENPATISVSVDFQIDSLVGGKIYELSLVEVQ